MKNPNKTPKKQYARQHYSKYSMTNLLGFGFYRKEEENK